ncbi:MAG: alpha-galactosidase, partial [Clostridia bacterium]|nr:alpha-galactosidase [Clostridia bacterium]
MTKSYAPNGGRSSDGQAPFFDICKNNAGYVVAVGWSGQWTASITRSEDDIRVQTGIEEVAFRLLPGERIRTSSVVIMPYQGDVVEAQNQWRRLVRKHFSLIGKEGRDQYGPFCASIWGGMRTQTVLERLKIIDENDIPFEYIWMDAGWYGIDTKPTPDEFEGDWGQHTGDWRVSPLIHPQGLKDVTEAVHKSGRKFLLWVEPERVIYSTPTAMAHPEYFLSTDNPGDSNRLLNLGNPAAWKYCYETLANLIETLKIDCYRQDFNFHPLPYWRKNDGGDRKGISEIKHINGLYTLWDALLERFPHLLIDNCASGGRRIDIETLRRSMPLWRSDYQCPANFDAEAVQCHHLTYNSWMPFSGSGSGRIYDEYRMRSAYDSSINTGFPFSEKEVFGDSKEKLDWLRKYGEEYLLVRPYFMEDFYPLTKVSDQLDVWCASQFNRPEEGDGIIQLFRREESAYETACFKLRGLDPEADYSIMDLDGDFTITLDGGTLMEEGFRVTLMEPRTAKILLYRAL